MRRRPRSSADDEPSARSVFERAVAMLAARARTAKDLRRRLIMKGEPAALVDEAIVRLTELGYLDDAAYALMVARGKATDAGWSGHRLRRELRRRGVGREETESAVREVGDEMGPAQDERLEALARKRGRQLDGDDPRAARRRLVAYLGRRGYDLDDVLRVVAKVLAEPRESRARGTRGACGAPATSPETAGAPRRGTGPGDS